MLESYFELILNKNEPTERNQDQSKVISTKRIRNRIMLSTQ